MLSLTLFAAAAAAAAQPAVTASPADIAAIEASCHD